MAFLGLIVALLALAVAGAIYQAIATKRAERAYPPPGEMVDVGGYSLHIFAVASLLARLGIVRLLSKLTPAPPELPQQRAQIDALSPSTRQVSTTALELRATPQSATQTRSLRSLGNKPLAVVSAPKQAEPGWLELQDDLVTLSSNSTHRVVKGATHTSLLYERSDAQASSAAIVDVVAAVRNDRLLGR